MSKDIILHNIRDWSKIDERESFWGKVDLLTPNTNFGIHRYSSALWTSGQVGVGRLFDREGMPIQDNGKDHVLVVTSSYDLNPWLMLESVLLDDEYEAYLAELEKDGRYLFRIFYDQPVIRLPHGFGADAETLFALSFASSCYALCKKGLKKSLIHYADSRVTTPYEVMDRATGGVTKDIVLGKNLFILGTMNTADKSIDAIDYAIRRRFIFIDSPASREVVLGCYRNASGNADDNSIELFLFDAVQRIFDNERFFNNEYQKSDVRIGHTYFLRDRRRGYGDAIIEHFVFQVVPILREYVKDGILDVTENLIPLEHTAAEIHSAASGDEQIKMLSENIMMYVKEFGNLNKSNILIDNTYIGAFKLYQCCRERRKDTVSRNAN